ncbi:MAG: nitroreductase family protein [Clostridia bacterium]|nr:nitroreductase family protein [Clostridia bacterium]
MSFSELAKKRYSVRKFKSDRIPDELLYTVLESARIAPTAKNMQPVKVFVALSDESLSKLEALTPCVYGAPAVLIICSDKAAAAQVSERSFAEADASIAASHMMLQATDLGLGSLWVGRFVPSEVKEAFGLPDNIEPYALMPIGYAADDCQPSTRHGERKDMKELAVFI